MGRCEGYTRIFQTMKNYCCLRPHGCFDSQILEDEAGHNFEHGVNFEHGPIREADGCLFCSLSVGNMKLLREYCLLRSLKSDQGRKYSRTSRNQATTQNAKNYCSQK